MPMKHASFTTVTKPRLTEIELCAWIGQAAPGDVLEYHRGLFALDRTAFGKFKDTPARAALDLLASRAYALAEQGLAHLVQRRNGADDFSYVAIARPKPKRGPVALSALMLKEAA